MSQEIDIVQKYIEYFDDCRPIDYKGFEITPFLAKDIRKCNFACYCLVVDPLEFEDITLMPLKRLSMILTIFERLLGNYEIKSDDIKKMYHLVVQSFAFFIETTFPDCSFDSTDPNNPKRKKLLRLINNDDGTYKIIGEKEFEDLAELILYYNGIDTSYKNIPAAMRKDAERVRQLINKQNKVKAPSIEKMIDSAFLYMGDYEKVLNLPVRKFYNLITNIQKREEYNILMSGMYVTKGVEHWMSGDYTKNDYKGVFEKEYDTRAKLKNF
jgi:hypothetical protein